MDYQNKIESFNKKLDEQLEQSSNIITDSLDQILVDYIQCDLKQAEFDIQINVNIVEFDYQILSNSLTKEINSLIQQMISIKSQPQVQQLIQDHPQIVEQIQQSFIQNVSSIQQSDQVEIKKDEISKVQNPIQPQYNKYEQQKLQNQDQQQQQQQNQIPQEIIFELQNQFNIKQIEQCRAIAFNKDSSIVISGCNEKIKIFQNQQGKLNQIQLLSEHKNFIQTLNFMKKSNNFVSGSMDNNIIIWQQNSQNQWSQLQKLIGHQFYIYCLLLNNKDDLIISGSYDNTIKFWSKQKDWQCTQTITDHSNTVLALSLTEQQNKLISCSRDQSILVIEQSFFYKNWVVISKLQINYHGLRLCFINDKQFTFQPYCKEELHLYEINNDQINKIKNISVKCGSIHDDCQFPQQYIKSKDILLNKNGKFINLLRKKQNDKFILEQVIEIGDHVNYGQLSEDGQYLIIWDNFTKEIRIRTYKKQ